MEASVLETGNNLFFVQRSRMQEFSSDVHKVCGEMCNNSHTKLPFLKQLRKSSVVVPSGNDLSGFRDLILPIMLLLISNDKKALSEQAC